MIIYTSRNLPINAKMLEIVFYFSTWLRTPKPVKYFFEYIKGGEWLRFLYIE